MDGWMDGWMATFATSRSLHFFGGANVLRFHGRSSSRICGNAWMIMGELLGRTGDDDYLFMDVMAATIGKLTFVF